jgi:hypothetical protein
MGGPVGAALNLLDLHERCDRLNMKRSSFPRRAMSADEVRKILLWCAVINYGILLVWFLFFRLAHDGMYLLHARWFRLSIEQFDVLHYQGMAIYKIGIMLLNGVPYIALRICQGDRRTS